MTADDDSAEPEQPDQPGGDDGAEEFEDDDQTTTETDARWTYTGSISALIMVTIGGFRYVTAGDSEDQVKSAKDQIQSAIGGLLLAAASWLILYTINPALLNFNVSGLSVDENTFKTSGAESDVESRISRVVFYDGVVNEEYTSGGIMFDHINVPYDVSVSGDIPPGLQIESKAKSISLSGTPTETGEYDMTFTIEDVKGKTFEESVTIEIVNIEFSDERYLLTFDDSLSDANTQLPIGDPWYRRYVYDASWLPSGYTHYAYGPYNSREECENLLEEDRPDIEEEFKQIIDSSVTLEKATDIGCHQAPQSQ